MWGFGSLLHSKLECCEEGCMAISCLVCHQVPFLGRVKVLYWSAGVTWGWSQCYLYCTSKVWNCICFSVVTCWTAQLRSFCLGYSGTVYSYLGNGSVNAYCLACSTSLGTFEIMPCCPRAIGFCYHGWLSELPRVSCWAVQWFRLLQL